LFPAATAPLIYENPTIAAPEGSFTVATKQKKKSGCGSHAIEPPPSSSQKLDVTNGDSGADKSRFLAGEERKPGPKISAIRWAEAPNGEIATHKLEIGRDKSDVQETPSLCTPQREEQGEKKERERERETTVAGSVGEPQV
jgi:hypothetical protein